MVSAKVSDAAGLFSTYTSNSAKNNNSQGVDFTEMLKKNSVDNKTTNLTNKVQAENSNQSSKAEDNVEDTVDKTTVEDNKIEESVNKLEEEIKKSKELDETTEEVDNMDIPSAEDIAKVASVIVNIKQEISKMLGITVEELDKYLNQLSIDLGQLKQPEHMMQLIMEVKNISNQAQLLVNPELSTNIKELLNELKQVVSEMPELSEDVMQQVDKMLEESFQNVADDMMVTNEESSEETVVIDDSIQSEDTVDITGDAITQNLGEKSLSSDLSDMSGNMSNDTAKNNDNEASFDNVMNIGNAVNNIEVVDGISEAITNVTGSYSDAEVISQIIERIKVTAKPGMTSMELQLYPEHLGKVTVQVVSKNGGITAQIAAENENVRGIIENQLVTLKESLNEQGIKVDSVEVTVANYGFEQNLNQQEEQAREQAKSTGRVRKSLLDEINGVISEEVLEETRMETVGNTVSYKA